MKERQSDGICDMLMAAHIITPKTLDSIELELHQLIAEAVIENEV
jgi:hypothetical protein